MKPMLASPVEWDTCTFPKAISRKLDGCLLFGTRIWTDQGLKKIGEIVDKRLEVKVASYNETTGEVEFKPVVGWFNNGLKNSDEWMTFSHKSKITKNHKVFTPDGWVEASASGQEGLVLDRNLGAAITGMLLGDGCAAVEKRRLGSDSISWRLRWSNCAADTEYGKQKARLLEEWVSCKENPYMSGFGHPQTSFVTSNCSSLPYDLSRFYVTDKSDEAFGVRKKDLSLCDISEDFNDLSLALWYFDDGTVQNNNGNQATPRIHFSVARYSEATIENFRKLFSVKYGCNPTIKRYGKDIKMSFSSPESVFLLWRIGRVAGSMMPRKLIDGIPQGFTKIMKTPVWGQTRVGHPVAGSTNKPYNEYDIEVADNHNYFAEGQLVHNCRAIVRDGVAYSRSLKPIPNKFIQSRIGHLHGYDGELIVGQANDPMVYRRTASGVMSVEGEPDFTFHVFDRWDVDGPWHERYAQLAEGERVKIVPHIKVHSVEDAQGMAEQFIAEGYEGAMLRCPKSPYKDGRATTKQGWLLKVKEWETREMLVEGMTERMHNTNEANRNALGYIERSSAKDGKVGLGTMGTLVGRDLETGVPMEVGTGFTDEERVWFWSRDVAGLIVKYRCMKYSGGYDKPRMAVYEGLRSEIDL